VFEVLCLNGKDLRDEPLVERKERLSKLVRATAERVLCVGHIPKLRCALYAEACRRDLEGIVAPAESPYRTIRGKSRWIKIKNPDYTQGRAQRDIQHSTLARLWPIGTTSPVWAQVGEICRFVRARSRLLTRGYQGIPSSMEHIESRGVWGITVKTDSGGVDVTGPDKMNATRTVSSRRCDAVGRQRPVMPRLASARGANG
jgi:hypothetical protein